MIGDPDKKHSLSPEQVQANAQRQRDLLLNHAANGDSNGGLGVATNAAHNEIEQPDFSQTGRRRRPSSNTQ